MIVNNPIIDALNKKLEQSFIDNKTWFYTDDFKLSGFVLSEMSGYLKYYKDGRFSENAFVFAFEALALYTLDRAVYSLINNADEKLFLEEFSLYSYYAHLVIHKSSYYAKCLKGYPYISDIM
jgi:hypothetical protein